MLLKDLFKQPELWQKYGIKSIAFFSEDPIRSYPRYYIKYIDGREAEKLEHEFIQLKKVKIDQWRQDEL